MRKCFIFLVFIKSKPSQHIKKKIGKIIMAYFILKTKHCCIHRNISTDKKEIRIVIKYNDFLLNFLRLEINPVIKQSVADDRKKSIKEVAGNFKKILYLSISEPFMPAINGLNKLFRKINIE